MPCFRPGPVRPALLTALVTLGSLLQAQALVLWQPVHHPHGGQVDVRYAWQNGEAGPELVIWNHGETWVHLGLAVGERPDSEQAHDHPRLHLSPKGKTRIPLAAPPGRLVVLDVRLTERDEGPFWRD